MSQNNFFNDVYDVVRLIPKGRVTSYGAIANYLGSKSSARMVGWALSSIAADNKMPAHRVLNKQGVLTGQVHFGPDNRMQSLLEAEGIVIKKDQVVNFEKTFWDPSAELKL